MIIVHQSRVGGILEGDIWASEKLDDLLNDKTTQKEEQFVNLNTNTFKKEDLKDNWCRIAAVLDYNFQGKKILDLGCGSNNGTAESEMWSHRYEPWLCRIMHAKNIDVIGVDCGDLSKEKFPNKKLDLLEENILINNFEKKSFDLIYASMLFNSPELEKRITGKALKDASAETGNKLKKILLPQIRQLLKSEGVFMYLGGGSPFMCEDIFSTEPEYVEHFINNSETRKYFAEQEFNKKYNRSYGGQY